LKTEEFCHKKSILFFVTLLFIKIIGKIFFAFVFAKVNDLLAIKFINRILICIKKENLFGFIKYRIK